MRGGRETSPTSPRGRRRGGYKVQGEQQRRRGRKRRRPTAHTSYFSPHFCATQFIWIKILRLLRNSGILQRLKGAHPTQFSSPRPSPCTLNGSGTQVCIPPPQASTAPYEVSLKEGVHTHSRERACMFAREESPPAWSTSDTEAGHDVTISPFNSSIHSRAPKPLQHNTDNSLFPPGRTQLKTSTVK